MQRFSYRIILRNDYRKKDGTYPLYLRVTINRKVKYLSLNISIPKENWDENKQKVIGHSSLTDQYNLAFLSIQNKVNSLYLDSEIQEKSLDFDDVFQILNGKRKLKNNQCKSLQELYKIHLDENKHKYEWNTIKKYQTELSKLNQFQKYIPLENLNRDFLIQYEKYMITQLENKTNTVAKSFAAMKAVIHTGLKKNILLSNPFDNYTIITQAVDRSFLNAQELKKLHDLLDSITPINYQQVLEYFLFSCYTGLRYSDIQSLKFQQIHDTGIYLTMHKTKRNVFVPLNQYALSLLRNKSGEPFQPVFHVFSNQATNRMLKIIMAKAGIKKTITFHSARHTFATISLNLGIPVEVVSKLLGHSNLKTTMIYARVLDETKTKEMTKWNNL